MSKTINISDKLSTEKPKIVIGQDVYFVDDSVNTIIKMEELGGKGDVESLIKALETALGAAGAKKMKLREQSMGNLQIIFTAVNAAIMGLDYDDADKRFQAASATQQ